MSPSLYYRSTEKTTSLCPPDVTFIGGFKLTCTESMRAHGLNYVSCIWALVKPVHSIIHPGQKLDLNHLIIQYSPFYCLFPLCTESRKKTAISRRWAVRVFLRRAELRYWNQGFLLPPSPRHFFCSFILSGSFCLLLSVLFTLQVLVAKVRKFISCLCFVFLEVV